MPDGLAIVALTTLILVAISVTVHYEGLRLLTDYLPMPQHHHRKRVILMIFGLLLMHVIEIWVFGIGYFVLVSYADIGELTGIAAVNLFDCVYYSAMTYTTIGFGDITPTGAIRLMTGMEGITGLTLITWSASYTFVVMNKTWKLDD